MHPSKACKYELMSRPHAKRLYPFNSRILMKVRQSTGNIAHHPNAQLPRWRATPLAQNFLEVGVQELRHDVDVLGPLGVPRAIVLEQVRVRDVL